MNGRIVIDASVAAKWYLDDEIDSDLAHGLLKAMLVNDLEFHVPRLFFYEVASVLSKACKRSLRKSDPTRLTKKQASQAITDLFHLPVVVVEPNEQESVEALEFSVDYSKTHYDSTYFHLARKLDCVWCTCDEKFLEATPKGFPAHHVLLLATLRT